MILRAIFSLFIPWRSILPNQYKRRHESEEKQSPDIITPRPPSSSLDDANGEKISTTLSNSSVRGDRNHLMPSPPSPEERHRQPLNHNDKNKKNHNHNNNNNDTNKNTRIRSLPLISSIFVPFSILLAIPGLTDHWYIRTNDEFDTIEFQPDPIYLKVMLGFSMTFAVITNLCLLVRLFEKVVRLVTILSIILLTLHDILDITVLIIFAIKTQVDDGFSLGQAFWTTLCSTIASFLVNITLILDYLMTSGVERDVSGLTKKQRALSIMIIILLGYIAFGAAVHQALITHSYIDALYFTVVIIETIGYGDITPLTTGARIFTSLYTTAGIVIIAMTIGLIHEALSEAIRNNFYARIRRKWKIRIKHRWETAVKWRLEQARLPVWVPIDDIQEEEEREEEEEAEEEAEEERNGAEKRNGNLRTFWRRSVHGIRRHTLRGLRHLKLRRNPNRRHMTLNLRALTDPQLQAAAMEAGAPLKDLLPDHFHPRGHYGLFEYVEGGQAGRTAPTQYRMGMMINLIGNFAYSFSLGQHGSLRMTEESDSGQLDNGGGGGGIAVNPLGDGFTMDELQLEEKRYFMVRTIAAFAFFFAFWLVGAAVFSATEKWSYGLSLYFCFVTFSTVGYGDPVPKTPAGRSIFVGWALCGVGTMTILISLLVDRYTEGYKDIIISSAAESTEEPDDSTPTWTNTQNNTTTQPASPMMGDSEPALTGPSRPPMTVINSNSLTVGNNRRCDDAVLGYRELLAQVDMLKELMVDEGAFREGKVLHTFESELKNMLSHIRRSRKLFTEGTGQGAFTD